MNKGYATATLEEYFATPETTTNVVALPAKALAEVKNTELKNRTAVLNRALKKYVINARQAQTNAKIVEALLA